MKRLPSNFKSPPTWDSFAAMALRGKGKIALLGTTDAGKSTLATFLLRTVLTAGKTAAFLDTDLGQTSEGLPGTLNLTIFSAAGKTVRRYSHFVGAFSPAVHFTEVLAGNENSAFSNSGRRSAPHPRNAAAIPTEETGPVFSTRKAIRMARGTYSVFEHLAGFGNRFVPRRNPLAGRKTGHAGVLW